MATTFLVPSFNKSEEGKVHNSIDVRSEHALVKSADGGSVPAIASEGFLANRDGTYVFVTVVQAGQCYVNVGFTSTKSVDSRSALAYPGFGGMNGVCAYACEGTIYGGNGESSERWIKQYLPPAITRTVKEIIAILTISENGKKRNVQFIFDGNEGPVHELATPDFENKNGGNEIYPVITMWYERQKIEFVPFNQVKSRSPRIEELMKQFANCQNNNNYDQNLPKKAQIKKTVKKMTSSKTNDTTKKKKAAAKKKKTAKKVTRPIKKAGKKIAKKK